MAQRKAKLYQRLRTKRFPWVACEMAKNGSPKPHADAFQFGIRYTIDGQRKLDTAATLDEAVTMLKVSNVRLYGFRSELPSTTHHIRACNVRLSAQSTRLTGLSESGSSG
jgi:hypothetical protein